MNILIVSRHEPIPTFGGIERMTYLLLKAFKRDGHNTFSLTLVKSNNQLPEDVTTDYFPSDDTQNVKNVTFLREYIKKNKIDILLNQYGGMWNESRLFLSCPDVIRMSEIHINPRQQLDYYSKYLLNQGGIRRFMVPFTPFLKWRYYRVVNKLFDYLEKNNDAIILLSDSYKTFKAFKNEKTIAMPNTVDKLGDKNIDPLSKDKTILYVGRLTRTQKQPEELIKVFKIVEQRHPDWQLKMIGDGPDRYFLEEYANKIGVKNITFTGFVNPFPYYLKSPILCLTSNFEGFPMTLIECMAYKTVPVIYNSFSAANDIITNDKDGILVKFGNHKEMAEKICWLIEHPDERCRMADAAYAKVRDNYYIDNVVKRWYALFDRLMKERKNA